jgi:hypothetical protein
MTPATAASAHNRMSRATFLPSFRGPARREHAPAQGFNCRGVTEIVSEPLRKLMVLQPADKPRVAIGTENAPHKRVLAVLVVNVRCLAGLEALLADRTLAALVGVDSVIVFRG